MMATVKGGGGGIRSAAGSLGKVVVARLAPGTELLAALEALIDEHNIRYGLILGGAASLRAATLRNVTAFPPAWPLTDAQRVYLELPGPLELLSITGNISRREGDTTHIHAHVVVSTGAGQAAACYGGHLVEGAIVFSTGEIALGELSGIQLARNWDEETKTLELYPTGKRPG
jgi:hypothetical protein